MAGYMENFAFNFIFAFIIVEEEDGNLRPQPA